MDRINLIFALTALAFATIPQVAADTVFAPSVPMGMGDSTEGGFPESRFGSAPARVDVNLGVTPHYAAKEAEEMDENGNAIDERRPLNDPNHPSKATRSPAGLDFTPPARSAQADAPSGPHLKGGDESDPEAYRKNPLPKPDVNPVLRSGVQEVALIASDLGFFPKTLFVVRDLPVRLYVTGASKNALCIMMDSFQVRKQVRSQKIEEITFTPNVPGKYRFYCPVNGMEGSLIVKELTTAAVAGN